MLEIYCKKAKTTIYWLHGHTGINMKIAIICDVLGKENNGTTIAAMNLIRYLRKQGHEVRVVCSDQDKKDEENVYIVPTRDFGKTLNSYIAKVGVTLAKADEDVIKSALCGVDHVHILLPFTLGKAATRIANSMNLPITASFHMQAQNFTSYFKLNKVGLANKAVYKTIYRNVYCHVDAIHYPTKFIQDVFERNIKQRTNGYVISNGVQSYVKPYNIEKPSAFHDKIVILSIGRYSREKSQDTLIKAVKYSKYRDNIQLILAGQGLKEKYYKKLAKSLPIKPIFKFYSRTEIIDVLNYSDLYVHSAEVELEGISCLEAIACGKLTIVSDSKLAATKHFAIDEKCVFKNRNPKDLARVIDYWIEHSEERKAYEKRYLNSARVFNQDSCMQEMEAMFLEVMNEKEKR